MTASSVKATVRPNLRGTAYPGTTWIAVGGGTIIVNVADQLDATGAQIDEAIGGIEKIGFFFPAVTYGALAQITEVRLRIRTSADNYLLYVGARLNGLESGLFWPSNGQIGEAPTTGVRRLADNEGPISRPGGGFWTADDLNAAEFIVEYNYGGSFFPYLIEVARDDYYVPPPSVNPTPREVATRQAIERQRPAEVMEAAAALAMLDLELGDLVGVSHYAGADGAGQGWGVTAWQRATHELEREDLDLDGLVLALELVDARLRQITFFDGGQALDSSQQATGIGRLDQGGTRTYSRLGNAYVMDPGDFVGRLQRKDWEMFGPRGTTIERAGSNFAPRSSFKSGTTGCTTSGTATNGSAIVVDATTPLFDIIGTAIPGPMRFTAGSPHTADLILSQPASELIGAGTSTCASFVRLDNAAAAPMSWRLQRSVDSWWWNDTSGAWQVGVAWNAMPSVTTYSVAMRHRSKAIAVGGTNTTLTLSAGIPTAGAVAGQINWLGHMQLDGVPWASSAIVTDGATATRAAASLAISNATAARCINNEEGCGAVQVTPYWSSAEIGSTPYVVLYVYHDASNWRILSYVSGQWLWRQNAAGVLVSATLTAAVVAGTRYTVAFRWTGTDGALGLAARTLSIMVDGVSGTDAVAAAAPTEHAASVMWIGSDGAVGSATAWLDGEWRLLQLYPTPMSDYVLARLPQ